MTRTEAPDDWLHLCDLCRTPQADLLAHQEVCPDALAYALHPESLGLREYWVVLGEAWNRHVVRRLGRPSPTANPTGVPKGRWYRLWGNGDVWGPDVHLAWRTRPKRGEKRLPLEYGGRVGGNVFSTPAHARADAIRTTLREMEALRQWAEKLETVGFHAPHYRKADEALVVHRAPDG